MIQYLRGICSPIAAAIECTEIISGKPVQFTGSSPLTKSAAILDQVLLQLLDLCLVG